MNGKLSRHRLAALGIGAALMLAASASSFGAQTAPGGVPASPPQGQTQTQDREQNTQGLRPYMPRNRDGRAGGRFERRGGGVERRLSFLHERLGIRADQESVWNTFADVVRTEARTVRGQADEVRGRVRDRRDGAGRGEGRRGPPSVVERLERRQQMLADRSDRAGRLLQELRPLYAALDQNQKRTADRLFFRMGEIGGDQGRFFNRRVPGPGGPGGPRFDRNTN